MRHLAACGASGRGTGTRGEPIAAARMELGQKDKGQKGRRGKGWRGKRTIRVAASLIMIIIQVMMITIAQVEALANALINVPNALRHFVKKFI